MANKLIVTGMKKQGMDEETLAKRVGVKKSKIVEWINDIEIPNPNYQAKICKVLDIPICRMSDYYALNM